MPSLPPGMDPPDGIEPVRYTYYSIAVSLSYEKQVTSNYFWYTLHFWYIRNDEISSSAISVLGTEPFVSLGTRYNSVSRHQPFQHLQSRSMSI